MSKLLSAPRALFVLGLGLLGGCGNLNPNGSIIDAGQMTPIATTNREPTCVVPTPPPAAAGAPAAGAPRAAAAAFASAPSGTAGPLAPFFLRAPQFAAPAAMAAAPGAAAPAPARPQNLTDTLDTQTSNVPGAMARLPDKLQNDKVMKSMLDLVVRRKQQMMASTIENTSEAALQPHLAAASAAIQAPVSKDQYVKSVSAAADKHQPAAITISDIKTLHQSLVAHRLERGMSYVSYYFDGNMVDRLGNKLAAPTFTDMKVTNADITGILVALLESAADDALDTPVWVSADGKTYYPGGSGTAPAALTYSAYLANPQKPDITKAPILEPMAKDDTGCGMTTLKAQAARYLANDAAVWAGSGTGLIMGLFGGVEVGPFVAFGKVSIGDNQTLQAIVQALITFAARRGTYEAIWPRLWGHYQTPDDRLYTLVSVLKIVSPADTSASSDKAAAK